MSDKKEKVEYTKSTAQLDAEAQKDARVEDLHTVRPKTENPDYFAGPSDTQFAVEGNDTSGYLGVSPEYATYSDDTSKPLVGGWTDEMIPSGDDGDEGGNESTSDTGSKSSGDAVGADTATKASPTAGNKGPSAPKTAGK